MKNIISAIAIFISCYAPAWSQTPSTDTLRLDLPAAEKIFLDSNLSLLAQHFNIDINKAFEKQARLWDNPYLQTDQTLYDGKWFRHTTINGVQYGQVFIQLTQLIRIGGKRNNLIRLSQDNTLSSTQQFDDMMRNLYFLLVTDFNNLYQLLETDAVLDRELSSIKDLVKGMDAQLALGNISLKENMRVKALQYSLQSNRNTYQQQILELEGDLRKLLAIKDVVFIRPLINDPASKFSDSLSLVSLMDSARNNRPDLKFANTTKIFNQHNLAYQKAQAYPDLNVGVQYDRLSNYVPNYWGLDIGLPLPIWNRNKGNIEAARFSIEQSKTGILEANIRADQEVTTSFMKYQSLQKLFQEIPAGMEEGYDKLAVKMLESYQQRQVNLIEFLDFFNSYRETRVNQLSQFASLRNSMAEINYTTGSKIFNLR